MKFTSGGHHESVSYHTCDNKIFAKGLSTIFIGLPEVHGTVYHPCGDDSLDFVLPQKEEPTSTVWNRIVLYRIIPHRIMSYRAVSYCTVAYRIVSYRTAPYRIILYARANMKEYCISVWESRNNVFFYGDK